MEKTTKLIIKVALYVASVLAAILLAASVLDSTMITVHWVKALLGIALIIAIVIAYQWFIKRGNNNG